MLLIAGGELDPNIQCLIEAAKRKKAPYQALLVGESQHPLLTWEIATDQLKINRRTCAPAAAFIRHDVFGNLDNEKPAAAFRAYAWYSTIVGYIDSHPTIRFFNRSHDGGATKPQQLFLARKLGMPVPWTSITNDIRQLKVLATKRTLVVKPVNGGEYCQRFGDVMGHTDIRAGAAAAPAIVQDELVHPDIRVYRIGSRYLSFHIKSAELDYRTTNNVEVTLNSEIPPKLQASLHSLTTALGLDYAAADFKADRKSGILQFLEVNSAPMFVAFDKASRGKLTNAILTHLLARGASLSGRARDLSSDRLTPRNSVST